MGVVLIVLFICFVLAKRRKRGRKRNRTTWHGKSDWEKTCDDGGEYSKYSLHDILKQLHHNTTLIIHIVVIYTLNQPFYPKPNEYNDGKDHECAQQYILCRAYIFRFVQITKTGN